MVGTYFIFGIRVHPSAKENKVYPYLFSAFGVSMFDYLDSETALCAQFGLGFKFKSGETSGLFVQPTYHTVFAENISIGYLAIVAGIYFGE